jgi:hypothetical protein
MHAGEPARNPGHMKQKVLSHLRAIQRQPNTVRRYFMAKKIRYAA